MRLPVGTIFYSSCYIGPLNSVSRTVWVARVSFVVYAHGYIVTLIVPFTIVAETYWSVLLYTLIVTLLLHC